MHLSRSSLLSHQLAQPVSEAINSEAMICFFIAVFTDQRMISLSFHRVVWHFLAELRRYISAHSSDERRATSLAALPVENTTVEVRMRIKIDRRTPVIFEPSGHAYIVSLDERAALIPTR